MADLVPSAFVTYYPDLDITAGMKSNGSDRPFVALVVDVPDDETVNLIVFDHQGGIHPMQAVPLSALEPPTVEAGNGASPT